MTSILEQLLLLQDRDVMLTKITQDLVRIPTEETQIQEKLEQNLKRFEEFKLAAKKIETQRRELEMNVQERKTRIAKYRTQQYETKKNDEYQALTIEISRTEEEIVKIEDQELELMEKYEAAQKEVALESTNVKEYTKNAEALKASLKQKQQNLIERQKTLQAELVELEKQTDPAAMNRYRRILSSKKDIAIVPVENGAICGGCHMKITPQTALQAKANTDLVACENCGRLLYWPKN